MNHGGHAAYHSTERQKPCVRNSFYAELQTHCSSTLRTLIDLEHPVNYTTFRKPECKQCANRRMHL